MGKNKKFKVSSVRKHAVNAPTIEEVSVGLALTNLYDEKTGVAIASRRTLADLTHYSEKRVRTTVRRMSESGRWKISVGGNTPKTFKPVM